MEETKQREPENCEFMPSDYFAQLTTDEIFENGAPLEVDLGCGDGSFLIAMAEKYPERNFLGVERLLGRVKKVARKASKAGLTNCKCPDPWPKARHHRRRLVQQDFLDCLDKVLKPGGEFCFKTDHPEYFEWVCEEMETFKKFTKLEWTDDTFFYPKTDFQRKINNHIDPDYTLT